MLMQFRKTIWAGMESDIRGETLVVGAAQPTNRFAQPLDRAAGRTLYVSSKFGADAPNRADAIAGGWCRGYGTIALALSEAQAGDIIALFPDETYTAPGATNLDDITILGLGATPEQTIISGAVSGTIDGWIVRNVRWVNSSGACISWTTGAASKGITLHGVILEASTTGLVVAAQNGHTACTVTIEQCLIQSCTTGVSLDVTGTGTLVLSAVNSIFRSCTTGIAYDSPGVTGEWAYCVAFGNGNDTVKTGGGASITETELISADPRTVGTTSELQVWSPCRHSGHTADQHKNPDGSRGHRGPRGGTGPVMPNVYAGDRLTLTVQWPSDGIDPFLEESNVVLRPKGDGSYQVTYYHGPRRVWPLRWNRIEIEEIVDFVRFFEQLDLNRLSFQISFASRDSATVRLANNGITYQRVGSTRRHNLQLTLVEELPRS